jgi:hypothetical protein
LALAFDDRAILPGINAALFAVSRKDDPSGRTHVDFRWSDGAGSEVVKSFVFHRGEPLVDMEVSAVDRGRAVTPRLSWGPGLEVEDPKHRSNTYYHSQALVYDAVQVTRYAKRKIDTTSRYPRVGGTAMGRTRGPVFHGAPAPGGVAQRGDDRPVFAERLAASGKKCSGRSQVGPHDRDFDSRGKTQLFVGPKNFGLLSSLGHGLEKAVWFSSYQAIYVCAKPVFWPFASFTTTGSRTTASRSSS